MPRDGTTVTTAPNDVLLMTGDAAAKLRELPDDSVNAVVTSPPYFGLRKYGAEGEIGLERSPSDYVANLVAAFREVRRVLRDDGSCWIVIGDSYSQSGNGGGGRHNSLAADKNTSFRTGEPRLVPGLKAKELIGIPWRLAFALSDDGWYRRHVIVWEKPNCFVESVKDRCTMSHEFVLHMTKRSRYFHDRFAIAEPAAQSSLQRIAQSTFDSQKGGDKDYRDGTNLNRSARKSLENYAAGDSSVRNARSVWTIPVEPSYVKHTAMFPTRLSSRVIRAATPDGGCCAICNAPMLRILSAGEVDEAWQRACGADASGGYQGKSTKDYKAEGAQDASATKARILAGMRRKTTIGWQRSCACPGDGRPPVPALVLDPFSGAGTAALSAVRLGRDFVGIDLKADYHKITETRLSDAKVKCLDTDGTKLAFRSATLSIT